MELGTTRVVNDFCVVGSATVQWLARQLLQWLARQLYSGWLGNCTVAGSATVQWLARQLYSGWLGNCYSGWLGNCTVAGSATVQWLARQLYSGWLGNCTVAGSATVQWLARQLYSGWLGNCTVAGSATVQLLLYEVWFPLFYNNCSPYEGAENHSGLTHKHWTSPLKLENTVKICFRSCWNFKSFKISAICSYPLHIFYSIFVQFMQFPVLDFGLDHSGSQPFSCEWT